MRTLFLLLLVAVQASAQVYNLKIVTDANPDCHDLPSLVHSATDRWETPAEKCWAMFYWNHIARRQTNPIELHGMALTDPIRQFNDYGYTMCSTISGINQSIWRQMGLKHRYWDISNHTVSEVFYDGRWHCYDNSLSAIYTLCDGKTIAGVEDIGKDGACELSHGKSEPGHIAKHHCLTATSRNGFLIGSDTIRSLDDEYRCFRPSGLKRRDYFYDWDYGHRYVLNVRPGESYTRHYKSLGSGKEKFVPNGNGKDPELVNTRYHLRGNGLWRLALGDNDSEQQWRGAMQTWQNLRFTDVIKPDKLGHPAEAVFRLSTANVATSARIGVVLGRISESGEAKISLSTDNGLHWKELWKSEPANGNVARVDLVQEVNGAYEFLIKVTMLAKRGPTDVSLISFVVETTTALNAKTQPRLNLGRNTVYVGAGEQTDSIVFWPDLRGEKYKQHISQEMNIASKKDHPGYMGVIHPAKAKEDAYLVYKIDAPRDLTKITYGGRFYNRAPRSNIDIAHSFDAGKTWQTTWTLSDTAMPWDVIHYETVTAPAGVKSVLVRYLMNTTEPSVAGCSIYAVRMEANHQPISAEKKPLAVTFAWNEVQADRALVSRSHTQIVDHLPATYTINVSGTDHPVMESLAVSCDLAAKPGYSDGKDAGGEKWIGVWETLGNNLATGKGYTLSHPSETNWGAGDPDGKKLTDGVAGPPYAGGTSYASGAIWKARANPTITLDLGAAQSCASLALNFHGYPWHDALKGQIKDKVEILISDDGQAFRSIGLLKTDLRWIDLPANHMCTDEETLAGGTFRLIPEKPLTTRFVRYKVTSDRMFCATEIEVLDTIRREPFDLKIAPPK